MTTKFPPLVKCRRHLASKGAVAQVDAALDGKRVDLEDYRPSVARNAVEVVTSG